MMVRGHARTDIIAVSRHSPQEKILFTDNGPYFELLPDGAPGMVVLGNKAYGFGIEREWRTGPTPGAYSTEPALYELALDGSNHFRKLATAKGEPSSAHLFINRDGTKIGYTNYINDRYTVFIHDVASGKLLQSWNATRLFHQHCPDCLDDLRGWFDDTRLFFNLQLGDDDSISEESHNLPGTYLSSEDGNDLGGIPPGLGRAVMPGSTRDETLAPMLIGQTSSGELVFVDFLRPSGSRPKDSPPLTEFLVLENLQSKDRRQILFQRRPGGFQFYVSPSGNMVAFVESRLKNYQQELHVWAKNLESGEENEMLMIPARTPTSVEPIMTLQVIGWTPE